MPDLDTVRLKVTARYDSEAQAAVERDHARDFLQAFYSHSRAEALADAIVEMFGDFALRNMWRYRAGYHNRSADNIRKLLRVEDPVSGSTTFPESTSKPLT